MSEVKEMKITDIDIHYLVTEVNRARDKFPGTDMMLAALMEEVGELANAIIEGTDWEVEALHVACVAMRIRTEGDRSHCIIPKKLSVWPNE